MFLTANRLLQVPWFSTISNNQFSLLSSKIFDTERPIKLSLICAAFWKNVWLSWFTLILNVRFKTAMISNLNKKSKVQKRKLLQNLTLWIQNPNTDAECSSSKIQNPDAQCTISFHLSFSKCPTVSQAKCFLQNVKWLQMFLFDVMKNCKI